MSNLTAPADFQKRQDFISSTTRSLSVYSPAGSGKTHAIVQRILSLLDREDAEDALKRLCVVTYTERAANEMRIRARGEALRKKVSGKLLRTLDSAFFGTIHALCSSLIRQYGYYLGIPGRLDVAENLGSLWRAFLATREAEEAIAEVRGLLDSLSRYMSVFPILEMTASGRLPLLQDAGPLPDPDFTALLAFENPRAKDGVAKGKQIIQEWIAARDRGEGMIPIPKYSKGGKEFASLWKEAFRPLNVWIARTAAAAACHIGIAFRQYRIERGSITFDDQIQLALLLIRHSDAGERILRKKRIIILDEAQDTDPSQFEILLALAGGGINLSPESGRFSMVGDPQQSIYGDRADIELYEKLHGEFARRGDEITFDVTFRCSRRVIDFVNRAFPDLLHGGDGQVEYVPLLAAPSAEEGAVSRLRPEGIDCAIRSEVKKAHAEAFWLAGWLASTGYEKLGARSWDEVAILCPRNRWLAILYHALRKAGLRAQVHSVRETYADKPPYAWLTALVMILCDPRNSFEICGVLREIFGISDDELARYGEGDESRFHLDTSPMRPGAIADALQMLASLRNEIARLPLRRTIDVILNKIRLRDRLLSLPEMDAEEVDRALQHLLSEASTSEKSGVLLTEFALRLQDILAINAQTVSPHPDAIQLISGQKSKGGEWDVVIVPYIWRRISTKRETSSLSTRLIEDEDDEALLSREIQEKARLLYVTMTRPRNALVIIDDRDLFPVKKQGTKTVSFGELLGEKMLDELEVWHATEIKITSSSTHPAREAAKTALPKTHPQLFIEAENASAQYTRKILPHQLATHGLMEDPELHTEETASPTPLSMEGVAYGTWWHEAMRWMPWSSGRNAWGKDFEVALADSPMKDRARQEWEKFLVSPLSDFLADKGAIVHTELPFLWKESPAICLEGIMDMALWHSVKKQWLLVDWKTDREIDGEGLLSRYRPQIEAYGRALSACTGKQVTGGLYSTVLGEWLSL